jgi:hypothetical protein
MRFWLPGKQIAEIKCKKSLKNGFYSELTETFQYQPSAESNSSSGKSPDPLTAITLGRALAFATPCPVKGRQRRGADQNRRK